MISVIIHCKDFLVKDFCLLTTYNKLSATVCMHV